MKVAAFTMVRDDRFLPLWIDYYAKQLGPSSLFVIDHGSHQPLTLPQGVNLVRLSWKPLDEIERAQLVSDFNAFLLASFEVVIFSDADELVVANPEFFDGLSDYVERREAPLIAGAGLALLHDVQREPEIDFLSPLTEQRAYAQFHGIYCKPLVSRIRTVWKPGFHFAEQSLLLDVDLYIFHPKAMDYQVAHEMLGRRKADKRTERIEKSNQNSQFRFSAEEFDGVYFATTESEFAAASDFSDLRSDAERYLSRRVVELDSFGKIYKVPPRLRGVF